MGERLRDAISPYLRSHADNPVDWFGWSTEAFERAKELDLPVMISVGYSSCHWCHVMARESFSDPVIAELLNAHFVSIKVDREEHPEVDASLMAAASAFTRNLGWPLTVFATPEGKTFYAGSYFPPEPAHGLPSFRQMLEAIIEAWRERRDQVEAQSEELRVLLQQSSQAGAGEQAALSDPDAAIATQVGRLLALEDREEGGFGQGSKFPNAPALRYLAEVAFTHADHGLAGRARAVLMRTLERMARSALRDPVEGGFFRYTVQADFTEPHYERMLYDNAQLLELYQLALANTSLDEINHGNRDRASLFAVTASGIADYLLQVLHQLNGGFASAQDSESDIDGVRSEGGYYQLDADQRRGQPSPALDKKILTGWNGLAIAALARYGQFSNRDECVRAAVEAADYLIEHHWQNGVLLRASESGRVSTAVATLEDYGLFARGLLELGLSTGQVKYLTLARQLVEDCIVEGADGTLRFQSPHGGDPVLSEQGTLLGGDQPDAALPSPLVAIALAGLALAELDPGDRLSAALRTAWHDLASTRESHPLAAAGALLVELRLATAPSQLVLTLPETFVNQENSGPSDQSRANIGQNPPTALSLPELSKRLGQRASLSPTDEADPQVWALFQLASGKHGTLVVVGEQSIREFADAGFSLFDEKLPQQGKPTVYECRNFVCALPKSATQFFIEQGS